MHSVMFSTSQQGFLDVSAKLVSHIEYRLRHVGVAVAWSIMGKHDVIHKTSAQHSWDGRPFSYNRHGPKRGGCCAPFGGSFSYLTQCSLGRGLPPYQVASWSTQPFGHNRHGPKIGGCAPMGEGAGFPSNTMWHEPRPTFISRGGSSHDHS